MTLLWMGEHDELDRELVGGKAYSLNRMISAGLPVPPAFVLTTEVCRRFNAEGATLADDVIGEVRQAMRLLQDRTGKQFSGLDRPLLVSVRSGAARSMPGMMDTVLNLGINTQVENALAELTGDEAYAADTHRRFAEQFRKVVGHPPSDDPWEQLLAAISAVFRSWNSPRATSYRRFHGIDDDGGTAVTVQAMVFGNLDDDSGTGVLFTRNPLTGDRAPYGEWLPRGQGEDVVSGRHDPLQLVDLALHQPRIHEQLMEAADKLETTGKDVQDIEFTVESGALWMLQSRSAKRSPDAAIRLAVSLHDDGILTEDEALAMVSPEQVSAVTKPRIAPEARAAATVLLRGEPACPGTASGRVVLDVEEAEDLADEGTDVILARPTTDPDDVSGMIASVAVLTEIGGSTSHAAVVSRELGKPCVVGIGVGTLSDLAGREVTVDGSTGEVFDGVLEIAAGSESDNPALATLAGWARARAGDVDGPLPTVFEAARGANR
ncbi:pyruvate, phosphate dikinase [Pseudonocardia spinosispora]|uniref:pyruvate, phosphate dikinase n=1 Tax=Pseudonocardia spinosispora TaxID=103441 RepID=UPI000490152B|nr:pyruvate, phosphate dikinase [Pseudonocardia spinosispora]